MNALSLLTPILIVGGMLLGFFTSTEAAAVAVMYALFLGVIVYKGLKPRSLVSVLDISLENL